MIFMLVCVVGIFIYVTLYIMKEQKYGPNSLLRLANLPAVFVLLTVPVLLLSGGVWAAAWMIAVFAMASGYFCWGLLFASIFILAFPFGEAEIRFLGVAYIWLFVDFIILWPFVMQRLKRKKEDFKNNVPHELRKQVVRQKKSGQEANEILLIVSLYRSWNQLFDLVTDWVVLIFWMYARYIYWSVFQITFIFLPIAIECYLLWDEVGSRFNQFLMCVGLGRLFEDRLTRQTRALLATVETHFESLPSILFGLFVLLSVEESAAAGPVQLSIGITLVSVSLKGFFVIRRVKAPNFMKAMLFAYFLSDVFVRIIGVCITLAVLQSRTGIER